MLLVDMVQGEKYRLFSADEAPLPTLRPEKTRGKRPRIQYLDAVCCIDTETSKMTHTERRAKRDKTTKRPVNHDLVIVDGVWIYQWCASISGTLICGRTADELIDLFERLINNYDLSSSMRLPIYIHNLSYDGSYLYNGIAKRIERPEIFAVGQRRAIRVTFAGIELRCSWKLSNRSLASWALDCDTPHRKLSGWIDYEQTRYPWTPLSNAEWQYQVYDVLALRECIAHTMQGETYRSVPMTSTGYVRRAMREACTEAGGRAEFVRYLPTAEQYILMRQAFSGGYTHANSLNLGIHHNVVGVDAASMYPACLLTELYPAGMWRWERAKTIDDLNQYISTGRAVIFMLYFENLELKDKKTCWNPYLSHSRAVEITNPPHAFLDNGKVVQAERAVYVLNENDWSIVEKQYRWSYAQVVRLMTCKKAPLPEWFRGQVLKWYKDKVQLKGSDDPETARRYAEGKMLLNACYGMTATQWAHPVYKYDFDAQDWAAPVQKNDVGSLAEIINNMRKPYNSTFLRYDIGLYTTSYARKRLFEASEYCKSPLYCDTDSVKGYDWDFDGLAQYNAKLRAMSDDAGATIPDPTGTLRPIGVFEPDGEYIRFSALHAKCYAYETSKGLGCTIAGVTKDNGYPEGDSRRITKAQELGSLEELRDGKIFEACGGTRSVYMCREHDLETPEGTIHSYGGVAIINTTYEISGTQNLLDLYGLSDPELPYK